MFVGSKTMLSKFEDFDLSLVERGELIVSSFKYLSTTLDQNGIGNYILAAHRGNLVFSWRCLTAFYIC